MLTRMYLCTDAGRGNDWEQTVRLLGDGELDAALEGLAEVVLVPLRHAHRVHVHLHVCASRARQQTRVCVREGNACVHACSWKWLGDQAIDGVLLLLLETPSPRPPHLLHIDPLRQHRLDHPHGRVVGDGVQAVWGPGTQTCEHNNAGGGIDD